MSLFPLHTFGWIEKNSGCVISHVSNFSSPRGYLFGFQYGVSPQRSSTWHRPIPNNFLLGWPFHVCGETPRGNPLTLGSPHPWPNPRISSNLTRGNLGTSIERSHSWPLDSWPLACLSSHAAFVCFCWRNFARWRQEKNPVRIEIKTSKSRHI